LAAWSRSLDSSAADAAQATRLLHRLLAAESDSEWLPTWDGQTQRYLGIIATSRALRLMTGNKAFLIEADSNVLTTFRSQLTYPVGYATPHSFDLSAVDQIIAELRKSLPNNPSHGLR
jgi:hypothetical protein